MDLNLYKKLAVLALLVLASCAEIKKEAEYIEKPAEQIYNSALDKVLARNFRAAVPLFDEVERQHPYSAWATQAVLMSAYSLYQTNQYDEAVNALNRYIKFNPTSKSIDYAYYLKGLCYYERIVDVGRDQKVTKEALDIIFNHEKVHQDNEERKIRNRLRKLSIRMDRLEAMRDI